jgi:protein phosphatase
VYLEEGEDDQEAVDNQGFDLEPGDILLLCSDGLTDLIWDEEILQTLRAKPDLKAATEALVENANQRGGHDNVTTVLLSVPREGEVVKKRNGLVNWLFGDD